jgi:molecular chaperone DnaK
MRKDAEVHAEEDAKRREEVETKNHAENLCYQVEKTLTENADKIPAEKKAPVEKAVAELKEALKSNSTSEIKAKQDALTKAMEAVTAGMYNQPGATGAGPDMGGAGAPPPNAEASSGGTGKTGDDGVIDAEFTMKDK